MVQNLITATYTHAYEFVTIIIRSEPIDFKNYPRMDRDASTRVKTGPHTMQSVIYQT